MKLFRAIPQSAEHIDGCLITKTRASRRIPRHVPYVVDNVWEYLRPPSAPSRRHSAYASPTPELALRNASSQFGTINVVWEIELPATDTVVICSTSDAKYHADVKRVPAALLSSIEGILGAKSFQFTQLFAPIYLPGVTKEDLQPLFDARPEVLAQARNIASFWNDAHILTFAELALSPTIAESSEIFFDSRNGYRLRAIKPSCCN
jgi:hypothetical protein